MQFNAYTTIRAKFAVYTVIVMILCFFYLPVLGQSLTVKDSVNFQKALVASHTDFDRINYELKLAEFYQKAR